MTALVRKEGPVDDAAWDIAEGGIYSGSGPVTLGYALLAVALGALSAVVVRRTLLAMSATALLVGVAALSLSRLRDNLWPVTRIAGEHDPGSYAWYLSSGRLTASGEALYWRDCYGTAAAQDASACMRDRGGVTPFSDYHPASHFWPLQLVETGILLVLAAAAVALAFRVLRRRHG